MKYVTVALISMALGLFLGVSLTKNLSESVEESLEFAELQAQKENRILRVRHLESELKLRDGAMEALEVELSELRELHRTAEDSLLEAAEEEAADAANPFMDMVRAVSASTTQSQNRKELNKLERELDLNAEQIEKIQAFFEEEQQMQTAMIETAIKGGTLDYEAMEQEAEKLIPDREYSYIGELLDDILTPEQQGLYDSMQEREAEERREATAYRELAQVQQALNLNEEQKDAVFAAHYEKAYKVDFEEWESLGIDAEDRSSWLKVQAVENERLLEALEGTLTPEQLEQYRFQMEEDLEMQKSMQAVMQGSGG